MKLYRFTDPDFSWKLHREDFEVVKETPKGYWIFGWFYMGTHMNGTYEERKKWVPKEGRNLFAFDTIEKALFNYRKRKEKQIYFLKNRLVEAEKNLEACDDPEYKVKRIAFWYEKEKL